MQHATSDFQGARTSFTNALALPEDLRDSTLQARALIGRAWTDFLLGDRNTAVAGFQAAIAQASRDELCQAEATRGLGAVLMDVDILGSFFALKKAEEKLRRLGNRYYMAQALHSLGNLYLAMGNCARAARAFQQSLRLKCRIGARATSGTLIGMAVAHRGQGRIPAAIKDYRRALRAARAARNLDHCVRIFNNLGELYAARRQFARAANVCGKAMGIAREIGSKELTVLCWVNRALAFGELSGERRRVESISKVKRLAEESGIPHLVWLARAAEARDFEREGRIADAICSYEGAIEEIERARSQRLTSGGRARYLEGKLEVYGQYIAFLHARTEARTHARWAEQALKIAEHAKARSLVESLPSLRRPPDTTLPAEVRARMDAILQNISRIQAGLLDPALPICERAGLFKALQENEDEWEDLHARLNGAGAILNKLVSPEEELQSLQENLRPGEIFLSYFLAERQSFVWAVDRSAVRMCALPSRQVLEGKVSSFRRLLTPPARRQGILSDMPGPGIALYKALIAPVAGEFALADRIMISPAGGLWYLPFEALSDGRSFLVERHHISYVPSASTLVALRRANSQAHAEDRPKTLLAVGAPSLGRGVELRHHVEHDYLRSSYLKCGFEPDPLPHAKNELRAIARLFPGSELRMDDLANEEWIKGADLTRYAYLHFATHGFPDEQQPERSALLLARSGNGREDGLLQVREIMSLKLDADLVVLSGCGTGLGQLVRGEGMLGLSFAFFSAGARSLVVALWDVRDSSTAAFMQAFYRGLRHGSPKAVALRQAKLSMLKSPRLAYRHPYFWAPFVLVGENT